MPQTKVEIRSLAGQSLAVGSAGARTVTIDRSKEAGGMGLGFNGGELLPLAIGGCYSNDLYREAAKQGITLKSVRVSVEADWGGDPVRAQNISFSVVVDADANQEDIDALIQHTDKVAEIPNSLRYGTQVTLLQTKVVEND